MMFSVPGEKGVGLILFLMRPPHVWHTLDYQYLLTPGRNEPPCPEHGKL